MRVVRRVLSVVTTAAVLSTGLAVTAPPVVAEEAPPPPTEGSVTSRADAVSARLAARTSGNRVEVLDERTDSVNVWANPDGSMTRETFTAPIRVRNASGDWQDVDATLVREGSTIRPRAVPFQVKFSTGGTGELVSLGDGTHRYALSWPGSLPEPVLSGTTATYRDVEPGTDLVLTATRGGFEQSLVLRTRPTRPVSYRLPVTLAGLTMQRGPAGEFRLKNAAGELVMRGPAPVMYDARRDEVGEPSRTRGLAVSAESSPAELVIAPDARWLADPQTEYPVVLDPTTTLGRASDTYVENGPSAGTNFAGSADLRFGLRATASGNLAMRSFVTFNPSGLAGKHIVSAKFKLWNWQSWSCTPSSTFIEPVTAAWNPAAVTWNTQPPTGSSIASTSSIYGYTGCLAAGWLQYSDNDTRDLVQGWVDGTTPNYGVRFHASETDLTMQRKNTSGDATSGNPPALEITYNSYPMSPLGRYVVGSTIGSDGITRHTPSTAPILGAASCDADGNATRIDFEVWNSTKTTIIAASSTSASSVASCMPKEWTVSPTLSNGTVYHWRARAHDGTDFSKTWSSWVPLDIDTTAPPAPSVTATTFTNGSWYAPSSLPPLSETFTFTASPTTDVAGYYYSLDDPDPSTFTTATSVGLDVNEGWHTLYVQTADKAGNRSSVTQFAFGYGYLGVTSPKDGARTAQQLTLAAVANPTVTQVTWEVVDPAGVRTELSGLSDANGPLSSGTVAVSGGVVPTVTWNLENQSPALVEGPIQLSATVSTNSGPKTTRLVPVTFDRSDFGLANATTSAGPGSLNLVTGNLQLSATDASLSSGQSDLSVGRTFNSRADDATPHGPFGPGWVINTPDEAADSEYTELTVDGTDASLILNGGDAIGFTRPNTSTTTFTPEYGFEGYTLTYVAGTPNRYDVTDLDRNVTGFTETAGKWLPTSATRNGGTESTTYTHGTYTIGADTFTRVTRIIAPDPSSTIQCAPTQQDPNVPETTRGCRSLKLTYFASSVTPPSSGQVGDYPNRLQKIEAIAYNPASSAMSTVAIAAYAYDSNGRLAQAWDPRLATLKTTYTYNADGQVATLTPPAEEAWTFAYAALSGDAAGAGRLKSVSRPTLLTSPAPATATTTFVYRVPVSGTGQAYDLSATNRALWGQQDAPTTVTAVFPATTTATFGGGSVPVPSSFDRATVHYLNVDGREVNTADANGGITTTEHDSRGNVVRTLTAGNRQRALERGATAAQQAAIAQTLSSSTVYSADGLDVLETFGPEHEVALSTGAVVRAREHTTNTYDEGMSGGPYHLVTTSVTSARVVGESTDRASESRTTKTEYGTTTAEWKLGQPTAVIVDAVTGGLNLATRTTYATDGRVLTQTLPKGGTTTNTAATRVTRYYTAGTHPDDAACGNKSEWVDLVCSIGPGGQPAGVALPTTYTTSYDMFNRALVVEEKVPGTLLRTTTATFDAAGRPSTTSVTEPPGTLAQPVPTIETRYDVATGRATETHSLNTSGVSVAHVSRVYNTLGQLERYTDADGNESTTTYDVLGRVATTNDGTVAPPAVTQTWTYDSSTEHRGLPTSLVDYHAGTWTASYDVDGTPMVSWPNGLYARTTVDETGSATALSYATTAPCDDASCTVLAEQVDETVHGQWTGRLSTLSAQSFTYDAAGRLTKVADTVTAGCTTRWYTFDAGGVGNSNRTKLEEFAPANDGACQTSAASSTVTSSFDTADRITTTGTEYDALGRTKTVVDGDALGSGALTVGYHVNDLVRSIGIAGGAMQTYTLDVDQQRVRSWTDGTTNKTHHYDGDGDNPAWTLEGGSAWTRNIGGISGDLAAIYDSATAAATLQLTNLHGDVVATVPKTLTTLSATFEASEYGTPRGSTGTRYAWLGGKQRAADTPGGLAIMGVRLYNPATGRFLQVDPVYGGNANTYAYPTDPINTFDLDGRCGFCRQFRPRNLLAKFGRGASSAVRAAGRGLWSATKRTGRFMRNCAIYMLMCAESTERLLVPIMILGASAAAIYGGVLACASVVGCLVGGPAIAAGILGGWAAYKTGRATWNRRRTMYQWGH